MSNDFAKSLLDNPYNRVEDGQKVTLMDILLKYDRQPGYMASPISCLAFNTDPDGDLNFPLLASMVDPSCSESIINWNRHVHLWQHRLYLMIDRQEKYI